MDDLGPGDVVEALRDIGCQGFTVALKGERRIISEMVNPEPLSPALSRTLVAIASCRCCGERRVGFLVHGVTLPGAPTPFSGRRYLCPCGWKKVGPGLAATLSRFTEDLTPSPATAKRFGIPELV